MIQIILKIALVFEVTIIRNSCGMFTLNEVITNANYQPKCEENSSWFHIKAIILLFSYKEKIYFPFSCLSDLPENAIQGKWKGRAGEEIQITSLKHVTDLGSYGDNLQNFIYAHSERSEACEDIIHASNVDIFFTLHSFLSILYSLYPHCLLIFEKRLTSLRVKCTSRVNVNLISTS